MSTTTLTTAITATRSTRRGWLAALAVAALALGGACSSGGDEPAVPETTATTQPGTTTTLPSAGAARTTADGVTLDVVSETVVTPATGCSMLTDQWKAANPGQVPPADLCEIPVDSRRFTATSDDRTVTLTVPLPDTSDMAAAMALLGQQIDGPLSLVVVRVSPEVASVSAAEGSQPVADIVAPADGLAALAVIGGYDRIEARGADGRVLTTCFAEPLADAGGQCVSQTPLPDPTTTTAPPD